MAKVSDTQKITIAIPLDMSNPSERKAFNLWQKLNKTAIVKRVKPSLIKLITSTAMSLMKECDDEAASDAAQKDSVQ